MKNIKEKKLTNFSKEDKGNFKKFLITSGLIGTFNAIWIPLMFIIGTPQFFFMGTCVSVASLGVVGENLRNDFDNIKNYINSKKYSKKYYKEMEEKIEKVLDYKCIAKKSYDFYFKLKNNSSTPVEFLEKIKIESFENALKAKMFANIHEYNLKGNEKYFNDMILCEKDTTLDIATMPEIFDLKQDKAEKYIQKYTELENKLKTNCDVRYLDLTKFNQPIPQEKGNESQTENVAINLKQNKHIYKTSEKPFEQ